MLNEILILKARVYDLEVLRARKIKMLDPSEPSVHCITITSLKQEIRELDKAIVMLRDKVEKLELDRICKEYGGIKC